MTGDRWVYGEERVAIGPGENTPSNSSWDHKRVCDPAIVKGEFRHKRAGQSAAEVFEFGMFYTALDRKLESGGSHQVALAVAHDLSGPWHKTGPVIPGKQQHGWGCGIPSVISLDEKSRLLVVYTINDDQGGRSSACEIDLSNADSPRIVGDKPVVTTGFTTSLGTPDSVNTGGAIAYDQASDSIWLIRPGRPFPATIPTDSATFVQLASIPRTKLTDPSGEWTVHRAYNSIDYGFVRFFAPGFVTDAFGRIDGTKLHLLVSVATVEGKPDWTWSARFHEL
ncbi:MAG: hypothetical protein U0361_25020, partial [Nitrospiraceae bacterium]